MSGTTDHDEERIQRLVAESIAEFGQEHTHKYECVTWRGSNWAGACSCHLDDA